MAFGGGWDDNEVMSEINMTPLVDVMLVLLIVFMITVPVLTHSVKIDLPRAENTPQDITPQTIMLSVSFNGDLHWNEDLVDEQQLEQRLIQAAAQQPQPEIHLRGDRKVEYEKVIQVMAAAQRVGLQKLGFVTQPD